MKDSGSKFFRQIFRDWPKWDNETISRVQNPEILTELHETLYKKKVVLKNSEVFENTFQQETRRSLKVNSLYFAASALLAIAVIFALPFFITYPSPKSGAFFVPLTLCIAGAALVLKWIHKLKGSSSEPDYADFTGQKKTAMNIITELKLHRPQLFQQDDHGIMREITSKVWTAQHWFLILSSNPKHWAGISMVGSPPVGPILILKPEIEFITSPSSRICRYIKATHENYNLMEAFIKQADQVRSASKLTPLREAWLKTSHFIYNDWETWKRYRVGELRGDVKKNFEQDIIESLTGSRTISDKDIDLLDAFWRSFNRDIDNWIKSLNVVSRDYIKKDLLSGVNTGSNPEI